MGDGEDVSENWKGGGGGGESVSENRNVSRL